jgi:hypothetical protein
MKKDIALRDDGFSWLFYMTPPCSKEALWERCVDWLDGEAQIKEIGMGAGEARSYNTKVGDLMGEAPSTMWWVPDEVMKEIEENSDNREKIFDIYMRYVETPEGKRSSIRLGDFIAIANIKYLIKQGTDPFEIVCQRAHEKGMRVWGREELRGGLPKKMLHRKDLYIPGTIKPDYKYEEVRKYREDVFAEIVEKGADGVSLDFCVYPPYLSSPETDGDCITELLRNLRKRFENDFDRKIDIICRLPFEPEKYGLLWRDWVKEGLVDVLIPSVIFPGELFDVPIDEYVEATKNTAVKIFGCLRPKCTNIDPDEQKGDEERGIVRLNRPITVENDRARAALLHYSGAAGLQIALGTANKYDPRFAPGTNQHTDQWKPHYALLGDFDNIRYEDKTYPIVNSKILSATLDKETPSVNIPFRIADDPFGERGGEMSVNICPIMRNLEDTERIYIRLNGGEKILLDKTLLKGNNEMPTSYNHRIVVKADEIHFGKDWWNKGRKTVSIDPKSLKLGNNLLEIGYEGEGSLEIVDVDVEVKYGGK